jgi:large repetitive protein
MLATRALGAAGDIPVPGDYGEGRTDIAVFRPDTATWFVRDDSGRLVFGSSGDIPVLKRP